MINKQQVLTALTAIIILSVSEPVKASEDRAIAYESEISTCVSAVNERANYDEATRVRHTIVKIKNTYVGYVLTIDTDVFAKLNDVAIRSYTAYCVAKGQNEPVKFRFSEIIA